MEIGTKTRCVINRKFVNHELTTDVVYSRVNTKIIVHFLFDDSGEGYEFEEAKMDMMNDREIYFIVGNLDEEKENEIHGTGKIQSVSKSFPDNDVVKCKMVIECTTKSN